MRQNKPNVGAPKKNQARMFDPNTMEIFIQNNRVVLNFNTSISNVSFTPQSALDLAKLLVDNAIKIKQSNAN